MGVAPVPPCLIRGIVGFLKRPVRLLHSLEICVLLGDILLRVISDVHRHLVLQIDRLLNDVRVDLESAHELHKIFVVFFVTVFRADHRKYAVARPFDRRIIRHVSECAGRRAVRPCRSSLSEKPAHKRSHRKHIGQLISERLQNKSDNDPEFELTDIDFVELAGFFEIVHLPCYGACGARLLGFEFLELNKAFERGLPVKAGCRERQVSEKIRIGHLAVRNEHVDVIVRVLLSVHERLEMYLADLVYHCRIRA